MRGVSVLTACNPTSSFFSLRSCGKAGAHKHVLPFSHNGHTPATFAIKKAIFSDVFCLSPQTVDNAMRNLNEPVYTNQKLDPAFCRGKQHRADSFRFAIAIREYADRICLTVICGFRGLHGFTLPRVPFFT